MGKYMGKCRPLLGCWWQYLGVHAAACWTPVKCPHPHSAGQSRVTVSMDCVQARERVHSLRCRGWAAGWSAWRPLSVPPPAEHPTRGLIAIASVSSSVRVFGLTGPPRSGPSPERHKKGHKQGPRKGSRRPSQWQAEQGETRAHTWGQRGSLTCAGAMCYGRLTACCLLPAPGAACQPRSRAHPPQGGFGVLGPKPQTLTPPAPTPKRRSSRWFRV